MKVVVTVDVEYGDRPAPDPKAALAAILKVLDGASVPATFFVQGRFAVVHPDLVRDLAERDPSMGLHGFSHVDYRRLSEEGIRVELRDGLSALGRAAPHHRVSHVRLPHGYGTDEPRIIDVLKEMELTPVGWDVSTFDWDDTLPLETSAARAREAVQQGGVVLFHSWPSRTATLIERLIGAAGPQGVVPLGEVRLVGRQSSGRTMHEAKIDPPRR